MRDSADRLPAVYDPELEANVHLALVGYLGQALLDEGRPSAAPDVDMGLTDREQNIFGNPVLPTNRDARLRTIANAINELNPGSITDETPEPDKTKPARTAVEIRKDVDKYLQGKVTIPGRGQIQRSSLTGFNPTPEQQSPEPEEDPPTIFELVRGQLLEGVEQRNLPVFQAIRQVEALNDQRIVINMSRVQKLNILLPSDMEQTIDDLLKASFEQEIISFFELHIKHLKAEKPTA